MGIVKWLLSWSWSWSKGRLAWLLIAAVLLLASCSSPGIAAIGDHKPMKVGLIAPVHAAEQGAAIRLGAEAAAKTYGMELATADFRPEDGAAEQLAAAKRLLDEGAAALLADPADEQVLEELAAEAARRGVPLIALNEALMPRGVLAAVSVDNGEAGRQAGEALAELLDGSGRVAIVGANRDDADLEERERGIREALSAYSGIEIVEGASCGGSDYDCQEAARLMLDREPLNGAFALEASGALGLAQETRRRELSDRLSIVAFGSQLEQLSLLQDGVLDRLVVQNDFSIGYLAMERAAKRLTGDDDGAPSALLETKVVDPDTMFWMNNQKLLFPFVQ
jgi:ribose transport system substrate-binding protein